MWQQAVAIVDASMERASGFARRALHFEVAHGWGAIVAQWRRAHELRVMLKRVANPRACGMLHREPRFSHQPWSLTSPGLSPALAPHQPWPHQARRAHDVAVRVGRLPLI